MSARKVTRRPKALKPKGTQTPVVDLTERWLYDLAIRTAHVASALLALKMYPYHSREVGAYGIEPLETMANMLADMSQSARQCASEIREYLQKGTGGTS